MVYNLAWCDFREKKDKQISAECLSNLASNTCSKVVLLQVHVTDMNTDMILMISILLSILFNSSDSF